MKKISSIQGIMKKIAVHVAALQEDRPVKMGVLTAMDAFVTIDPILGLLNKQLLDARHYFEKAKGRHGADSPMAQVAADMAASAESAFQTRLIELRRDKKIRWAAVTALRAYRLQARQTAGAERCAVAAPETGLKGAGYFTTAFESASRNPSLRAA